MLATSDFLSFSSFRAPSRTSFLAPIDPNAVTGMGVPPKSPRKTGSSSRQGTSQIPFSKRPIKSFSTGLRQKVSDRTGRVMRFLNDVRQKGEDKRWAARGGEDEMVRTMFQAEQEQWEMHNWQQATEMESLEDEDTMHVSVNELAMLEDFEQQEQKELEALVALYEQPQVPLLHVNTVNRTDQENHSYGIEDEDLDAVFNDMDFTTNSAIQQVDQTQLQFQDTDMSMSG